MANKKKTHLVKVDVDDLNIRKGPGYQHERTGQFTGKGTFTITAKRDGFGKLEDGSGWICLDYCEGVATNESEKKTK